MLPQTGNEQQIDNNASRCQRQF